MGWSQLIPIKGLQKGAHNEEIESLVTRQVQSQGLLLSGRGPIPAEHAADDEVLPDPTAIVSILRMMSLHLNKPKL